MVRPGVNTQGLDEFAEKFIRAAGGIPAFKGYRGYPKTLCTSLNEQVVHGIPSRDVVLKEGDIISLDLGVIVDGFYGDAAVTLPVGTISPEAERLSRVTEEALSRGSPQPGSGTGCTISHTRSRPPRKPTGSPSCGISWDTESAGASMRIPSSRTSVNRGAVRGSRPARFSP